MNIYLHWRGSGSFFFFFFRTLRPSSIGLHIHSHSPVTLLDTRFQQRAPNKVAGEAHSRHHQVVCMCNKHQNCLVVFSSHTGIGSGPVLMLPAKFDLVLVII